MKRSARGFTLMELLVVLALAAVLLGLGVPAFRDFARSGRLTGAANEMLVTIVAARDTARLEKVFTALCPSSNPDADGADCDESGTAGWIAFTDTNNDCEVNGADRVVAHMEFHSAIRPVTNSTCIAFKEDGFRQPMAGQPGTARAMFCDERGNAVEIGTADLSAARGIEILPTGRAYVSRGHAELTSWGASEDDPVSCP